MGPGSSGGTATTCRSSVPDQAARRRHLSPALVAILLLGVVAAAGCGDAEGQPPGAEADLPVEIRVEWRYAEGFPGEMELFEPPAGQSTGETHGYERGAPVALGDPLPDATLHGRHGVPVRFLAVYRNPTDRAVRFWVTPHITEPVAAEAGLLIVCLCLRLQYEVPPGGTWTRVMEAGIARRAAVDEPITLTHVVVQGELPGRPPP